MRRLPFAFQIAIAAGIGALGLFGFVATGASVPDIRSFVAGSSQSLISSFRPDCTIKGNISIDSGEHIFHVRGQRDYESTIIRPEFGERWFCSEAEARAAGWRKAGR